MFKKIAVALDGSQCADEALDVALKLARSESAELAVCSVIDPLVIAGTTPPSPAVDQIIAARETESRHLVEEAVEKAHRAGIEAEGETRMGPPFDEILQFSKRHGVDAIVMGTHGRTGLKRLFLGSVAEYVLRAATCPVIVVREGAAKAVHA